MSDDTDILQDLGPAPARLSPSTSMAEVVAAINELRDAGYEARAMRHKHRSQVNRAVNEVRDDMLEGHKELASRLDSFGESQKRIERGLFGDEFGQKGMVHRLEAIERQVNPPAPSTVSLTPPGSDLGAKFRAAATEWGVKILVLVGILIVYDYSGKALDLWKAGAAP